ncbi:regulatory protein [Pustulibacterium marinum]|uniref:Regulatory protein RecX n=1 Tax=Pustulibacterium marinum TaxID=1224947 RepID=A0A1I7F188_9FLAO|nr:regulatory protein RecX [Pustulibacterium marinum]SFU29924.1 regulatory protein [Pustulibacterium marinum]
MQKNSFTVTEALIKMQRYCAYQDRCHKEVTDKLYQMRMIPEAIDHIIGQLIQDNFLNEERFARSFARGKFKYKKWGRRRIVQELKQREISKFMIDIALKEISEYDYLNTFHELAEKRNQQISESNKLKRKKKLADYLLYRGWESHLVYEKVNELV